MPTPSPRELVTALRDWGVDAYAFRDDWSTHARPGAWNPTGIIHHHTGGSAKLLTNQASQTAMLRMLWSGRPDLNGPLCHLAPHMDGDTGQARVALIGYGKANHAGRGSSRTLSRVRAGSYDGQSPGSDDTDGNPLFWGFEYLHPGTDLRYPEVLLDAGHRAHCAVAEASGWPRAEWPGVAIEHREWTTRKPDRSWQGDLRSAIRIASLRTDGEEMPTQTEWDDLVKDVASLKASVVAVPKNVWAYPPDPSLTNEAGKSLSSATVLLQIRENVSDIELDVAAIGAKIASMPVADGLTQTQIDRLAVAITREVLAAVGDAVLVEAGERLKRPSGA